MPGNTARCLPPTTETWFSLQCLDSHICSSHVQYVHTLNRSTLHPCQNAATSGEDPQQLYAAGHSTAEAEISTPGKEKQTGFWGDRVPGAQGPTRLYIEKVSSHRQRNGGAQL